MAVSRDLQLLLVALRDRIIDPGRLADAACEWSPKPKEQFLSFLVERGIVTPHDLRRLEAETIDQSLQSTPPNDSDPDQTTDHPPSKSSDPVKSHALGGTSDRYEIIRLHQSGGLGQVWLARDTVVDREIALKTMRPDRAGNANGRSRFLREARVTGQLQHPSIVPLYDLGGDDADPFYVMRFVTGPTLSEAAADYHKRRLDGRTTPLDLNHLIDAFVSVCRAVAFAHSRNILHRDLKGQNIIVGGFGEVFLLDWGLAKHVGEGDDDSFPTDGDGRDANDDLTAHGSAVGTPAYMAPEVAAGGAATKASDVYGLGALLYALLAGRAPYTGTTAEILKTIATADPAPIQTAVPPALAAIARKAMSRNPADRYPSAEEVATEVRRWLADEPVQAHREPFIARTARRARRHKTKVVAAAVLLLTTAIASSAAAGMLWREKQKTNQAWQQAEVEKGKATQNAETAVKVVRELSAYVNQVETGGSQRTTASDRQRRDAIDATLSGYEKLLAIYPDEPAVRMNVARMYRLRANLARFLKETDVAEKSYREARRHYGLLMTAEPGDSFWRSEAALVDYDLALFLMTPGRLAEANDLLNDSIREYDQLRRAEKGISGRPRVLGHMHIVRSELDDQLGRFADSERAARTAVELLSGLADPPQPLDPMFLGMAESRVAIALREQGRTDDAIAAHDAAVGRLAGLMMRQPTNRDVIHQYHQARAERAWTLSRVADRRAAAITDLDAAIAEWEKLEKQYPDAPSYPKNQGLAKLYRGRIKMLLSQMDAGAADLKSAATIFEALAGKYADVPAYRADLGRTFSSLGQLATDPETAAEWYRKARESLDGVAKQSPLNARYVQAMQELDALAGKSR